MQLAPQLPPVDPEYLVIERRAEHLHTYARGLLQHLVHIRAGGKPRGYPITSIRSAAVWLIGSYAQAGIPPAHDAVRLIKNLVQPRVDASTLPVRRASAEAYWAAIAFEAGQLPDPTGRKPSAASLYSVARHVRPRLSSAIGTTSMVRSSRGDFGRWAFEIGRPRRGRHVWRAASSPSMKLRAEQADVLVTTIGQRNLLDRDRTAGQADACRASIRVRAAGAAATRGALALGSGPRQP